MSLNIYYVLIFINHRTTKNILILLQDAKLKASALVKNWVSLVEYPSNPTEH